MWMPDLATHRKQRRDRKRQAKAFGPRLRRARIQLQKSQREVAEELGISQPRLCQYEGGQYMPPADVLEKIKRLLGVAPVAD